MRSSSHGTGRRVPHRERTLLMTRFYWISTWCVLGLFVACGDDAASSGSSEQGAVCEPMCEPYGPSLPGVGECVDGSCTPTFMECFESTEFSTCRAQCEAIGSTCGDMACAEGTYMIHSSLSECSDPGVDGIVVESRGCDDEIDWQVNTAARCCCEQNP